MKTFNNRVFKFWNFTVSHNLLIIRSPQVYEDMENFSDDTNFNIDVEFSTVQYFDIPSRLDGLEIKELERNIPTKFSKYTKKTKGRVFEIKSGDENYYIVADSYRIGTSKWDVEDRISDISLDYDKILDKSR